MPSKPCSLPVGHLIGYIEERGIEQITTDGDENAAILLDDEEAAGAVVGVEIGNRAAQAVEDALERNGETGDALRDDEIGNGHQPQGERAGDEGRRVRRMGSPVFLVLRPEPGGRRRLGREDRHVLHDDRSFLRTPDTGLRT